MVKKTAFNYECVLYAKHETSCLICKFTQQVVNLKAFNRKTGVNINRRMRGFSIPIYCLTVKIVLNYFYCCYFAHCVITQKVL